MSNNKKYIVKIFDNHFELHKENSNKEYKTFFHENVKSVIISPDSKWIISSKFSSYLKYWKYDDVKLWNIESGLCIEEFKKIVKGVRFSSSGEYIIFDKYKEIELYKLKSLQEIIDETREKFKDNPLTNNERREYFLE